MYILPSHTEFSLAELLPYILESPNCSCNGLSAYDLQSYPENTGILFWYLILFHAMISVHCMKMCFIPDTKQADILSHFSTKMYKDALPSSY